MTTPQKTALTLLLSVILFGAFTVFAFTGLFDLIEARFYDPSVKATITREIVRYSEAVDRILTNIEERFSSTLLEPTVRRSFLVNQSAEDIFERSRIFGHLVESIGGLQWVRFVDADGSRIHFSTHAPDIVRQDQFSIVYRTFDEPGIFFRTVGSAPGELPKFLLDEAGNRLIFSFPFYDSFDVFRGTALFSVSIRTVTSMLIREGSLPVVEDLTIISNPPGFLSGVPVSAAAAIVSQVAPVWAEGGVDIARLRSPGSGVSLTLFSVRGNQGLFFGRLVSDDLLTLPRIMEIILLVCFFLTVYLTVFLIFSFRQDTAAIIQNRLKRIQISFIEQYYDHKSDMDWGRWERELKQRKEEINAQVKRGLRIASRDRLKDIDTLIDKSWDELFSIIGKRREATLNEDKLQQILNRILAALPVVPAPGPVPAPQFSAAEHPEELDPVEEGDTVEITKTADEPEVIEELEPAEELEELEEAEEPAVLEDLDAAEEEPALAEKLTALSKAAAKTSPVNDTPSDTVKLANAASEIEFSPAAEPPPHDTDEYIWEDLEIISPFSGNSPDVVAVPPVAKEEIPGGDSTASRGLSLISPPFFSVNETAAIEPLEAVKDAPAAGDTAATGAENATGDSGDVIEEREGVPYINGYSLDANDTPETELDQNFKKLVDSIIK